MKRVLVITYYWPPSGGSGVQRIMYVLSTCVSPLPYFKRQFLTSYASFFQVPFLMHLCIGLTLTPYSNSSILLKSTFFLSLRFFGAFPPEFLVRKSPLVKTEIDFSLD